jgi:CubicO group peptidase (beta-lactamase class C family)
MIALSITSQQEKFMIASPIRKSRSCSRIGSVLIPAFLVFVALTASAQIVQPSADALAELDRRVQAYMNENNIPGGLVAVASRGQIIHLRTYGMANVELSVPVTDSTQARFR